MRKKIAVFLGEMEGVFQQTITKSVVARANSLGYDTVFFSTYASYSGDNLYDEGELFCIEMPDYDRFDGIIVMEELFNIAGMGDRLYEKLMEKAKCPIVYLLSVREGCYSVLVENTLSVEQMTRHFIEDHGFLNLCYMSGKKDALDAQERLQGFLNVMKEKNIPVTEHMIFHGDYWREKGEEAVNWFMEGRKVYPQAIICANDYMAMSICDELRKRKVRIPDDVCVSGFDYAVDARSHEPTISSLAVDFEQMSYRAVDIIDHVNSGRKEEQIHRLPLKLMLHNSCGCGPQWKTDVSAMIENNYTQTNNVRYVMRSTVEYQNATQESEYLAVAEKYRDVMKGENAWLCLHDLDEAGDASGQMTLKRIFQKKRYAHVPEQQFDRKDIIPEWYWSETEPTNLVIFSLHFKDKVYGYMAVDVPKESWFDVFTQAYFVNLANAIENNTTRQMKADRE